MTGRAKRQKTVQNMTLDDLTAYPPELYKGINLNWLVLFSAASLEERGFDLSFEHIVISAFKLFPRKFSLIGYGQHPDAKRVHDALWRCAYKNRQWLLGRTSQGFAFTERGREELKLVKKALSRDYEPVGRKKALSLTRRFEKLVAEVRISPAYIKYSNSEQDKVTEAECCHVLQGTLDSNRRVLADNLARLLRICEGLGGEASEVIGFLHWLRIRFARFLEIGESHGKIRHTG